MPKNVATFISFAEGDNNTDAESLVLVRGGHEAVRIESNRNRTDKI